MYILLYEKQIFTDGIIVNTVLKIYISNGKYMVLYVKKYFYVS